MISWLMLLFALSLLPGLLKFTIFNVNLNLFGICAVITLPFMILVLIMEKDFLRSLKEKKMLFFLLTWLFFDIVGILHTLDLKQWIKYNYFFILGLTLAILFLFYLKNAKDYKFLLIIINVVFLFHNFIGLIEVFTKRYFFLLSNKMIVEYIREGYPVSMFGNTNDFAIFLVISGVLILILNQKINNPGWKLGNRILIINSLFLVYKTQSRACWGALVIAVLIYLILYFKFTIRSYNLLFFLGCTAFVCVISICIIAILRINVTMLDSIGIRINLIKNGILMLRENIVWGVGSGNIEVLLSEGEFLATKGIYNMHNWWVEILVSFGSIIFTIYCMSFIKILTFFYKRGSYSIIKKERKQYFLIVILIVVFAISCISSSSINSSAWLWILYGALISYYYYDKRCMKES